MKKIFLILLTLVFGINLTSIKANTTTTTTGNVTPEVKIESLYDLYKNDGIYLTPSTGEVKGLVVPVFFKTTKRQDKFNMITELDERFNSIESSNLSVSKYYSLSSYGKLDLEFDIYEYGLVPKEKISFYERAGSDRGTEYLVNEFFKSTENDDEFDYTKYDSNNDGYIDALYFIYDVPFDEDSEFFWAYTSIFDLPNYNYPVSQFVFMSYEFFKNDNSSTAIHETGHLLGLDDYYDYNDYQGIKGGLGGFDMMDHSFGDHNPISKILLGWIEPKFINTSKEINLKEFSNNGEVIVVSNEKEFNLFSEYILIDYLNYNNSILNKYNLPEELKEFSSFVRVQRVDARLSDQGKDGDYYSLFHSDNSDTKTKFIEIIEKDNNNSINNTDKVSINDFYVKGDILNNTTNNTQFFKSNKLEYGFEFKYLDNDITNSSVKLSISFYNENPKAPKIEMPSAVEIKRGGRVYLSDLVITDYNGNNITEYEIIGEFDNITVGTYQLAVKAKDSEGNIGYCYFDVIVTNKTSLDLASNVIYICIAVVLVVGAAGYLKVQYDKRKKIEY